VHGDAGFNPTTANVIGIEVQFAPHESQSLDEIRDFEFALLVTICGG
jgi:hypothetical protein